MNTLSKDPLADANLAKRFFCFYGTFYKVPFFCYTKFLNTSILASNYENYKRAYNPLCSRLPEKWHYFLHCIKIPCKSLARPRGKSGKIRSLVPSTVFLAGYGEHLHNAVNYQQPQELKNLSKCLYIRLVLVFQSNGQHHL